APERDRKIDLPRRRDARGGKEREEPGRAGERERQCGAERGCARGDDHNDVTFRCRRLRCPARRIGRACTHECGQITGSQLGSPQLVPQTTVSPSVLVPQTTVSPSFVPQTTVSPSLAPVTAWPLAATVQGPGQSPPPQVSPQTMFGASRLK